MSGQNHSANILTKPCEQAHKENSKETPGTGQRLDIQENRIMLERPIMPVMVTQVVSHLFF